MYDTAEHPALGQSPRAAWLTALERVGTRQAGVHALTLEDFRLLAMPSTPKGTATVTHQGLQVNSLLYQGLAIRDRSLRGHAVPVRLDPWDAGTIYAYVHGVWEPCTSIYYSIFQGHSWKEIGLLTQELNRQRRKGEEQRRVSAGRLADFLLGIWERERTHAERLRQQRERDQEMANIRTARTLGEAAHLAPVAVQGTPNVADAPSRPEASREALPPRPQAKRPVQFDRSRLSALPVYR